MVLCHCAAYLWQYHDALLFITVIFIFIETQGNFIDT